MGSLAGLLKSQGFRVTGSDRNLYPPMSTALENWGIPIKLGFCPEHVLDDPPDLVVVGNSVRSDNPEACAALEAGFSVSSFPDALYDHAIRGKHSIVVAGTHGKSTTTAMTATLLDSAGLSPSAVVGARRAGF